MNWTADVGVGLIIITDGFGQNSNLITRCVAGESTEMVISYFIFITLSRPVIK